ncbi:hypothetical protein BX265_2571 [Streptomyces sp. TLI_235]|nr:hypothetical protein BX265_2571 [Streptomyces sp. TLI_235]
MTVDLGLPGPRPAETPLDLTLLYRGPLASCDYDCPYCPFAKRRDTPERLRADRAALERFTAWAAAQTGDTLSVLFTPWGEGLVRSWYRRALVELSHLPHVRRVAIQTNLSCRTDWLAETDRDTVALWVTYHPGQVDRGRFLAKVRELAGLGVRHSVGIVGEPEHLDAARRLRADLPASTYLWVNAADGRSYTDGQAAAWAEVDPLFGWSREAAPERRPALPHRRVGGLGGRRRHGAPLPLRPPAARQSVRRLLPGRSAAAAVSAAGVRLPHRLCAPGEPAAVRRLRGRRPGARPARLVTAAVRDAPVGGQPVFGRPGGLISEVCTASSSSPQRFSTCP